MQTNTPKWLALFITAFGAKGLVALAWWAGAFHAQRIRELQTTYPILQITGGAGAGKSTLVASLWKLTGSSEDENISAGTHTMGALLALLASAVNRPVVIEESGYGAQGFDWEDLRECYAGGDIVRRIGSNAIEGVTFRGALAFVGGETEVLNSRIVDIHLVRQPHTDAHREAIQALYELQIGDFAEFINTVRSKSEQVVYRLGHVAAYAASLQEDTERGLSHNVACNHAQLRALLDLLADLFPIPGDALHEAHCEVSGMAWQHVTRTAQPGAVV